MRLVAHLHLGGLGSATSFAVAARESKLEAIVDRSQWLANQSSFRYRQSG